MALVLCFLCFQSIWIHFAFLWSCLKGIICFFPLNFCEISLKSSFDQTSWFRRQKFLFWRSFFLRVFCQVPIWLVRLQFWRSVPFVEKFARFASSLRGDFCLYEDNISFSAKRFVCSHFPVEGDSETGLVRVLFQVDERFFFVGGLLFLQKMTNVILPKYSEFYEWGLFWRPGGGEVGEFCESPGVLYWRFVVGLDHKLVVSEVHHLGKEWSKFWKRRTVANI